MTYSRRRDKRIEISDYSFLVAGHSCNVINVSRVGLGVRLPTSEDAPAPRFSHWKMGVILNGDLCSTDDEKIHIQAEIRVRQGNYVGLEFTESNPAFFQEIRSFLFPLYVSSSIYSLDSSLLGEKVDRAWVGSEGFQCVLFKETQGLTGFMLQLHDEAVVVRGQDMKHMPIKEIPVDWGTPDPSANTGDVASLQRQKSLSLLQKCDRILRIWNDCPTQVKMAVQGFISFRSHQSA